MPPARKAAPTGPAPDAPQPIPVHEDAARQAWLRAVSHDLRTPLNAIIGFSDLMTSELYGPLGSDQYRQYATIIHDSGVRLLQAVNDILEAARLADEHPEP